MYFNYLTIKIQNNHTVNKHITRSAFSKQLLYQIFTLIRTGVISKGAMQEIGCRSFNSFLSDVISKSALETATSTLTDIPEGSFIKHL